MIVKKNKHGDKIQGNIIFLCKIIHRVYPWHFLNTVFKLSMTIPEQLKRLRKSAKLTQKETGRIIGVEGGAICNYEKGRRPIRAEDFEKIKSHLRKAITKTKPTDKAA